MMNETYLTELLGGIGTMAFLTAAVVQTIKELPGIKRIPTNVTAFAAAVLICIAAAMSESGSGSVAEHLLSAVMAAFPVYLTATGGWEKVQQIMVRVGMKKEGEKENE